MRARGDRERMLWR